MCVCVCQGLRWIAARSQKDNWANLLLFLGSSIGNYDRDEAVRFIKQIWSILHHGDLFLIGFDLRKSPKVNIAITKPHHSRHSCNNCHPHHDGVCVCVC